MASELSQGHIAIATPGKTEARDGWAWPQAHRADDSGETLEAWLYFFLKRKIDIVQLTKFLNQEQDHNIVFNRQSQCKKCVLFSHYSQSQGATGTE